jgi:hypothetical protein
VRADNGKLRANVKIELVGNPVLGSLIDDLLGVPSRNVKIMAYNSGAGTELSFQLGPQFFVK